MGKLFSESTGGFYDAEIHGDGVPADAIAISDADWRALLSAQSQGQVLALENGTVVALTIPESIPASVTMRQARLALLAAGKYDAVNTAITAAGAAAKIEWEFAITVERSSALVATLAAALDLSDTALDSLFKAASKL